MSHTSAGCIRSRGGIGVPISYQQCDRAEAEAAFQTALGRNAAWYLDQIEDAVGHPQEANELVTELTGRTGSVGGPVGRAERRTVPLITC